MQPVKTSTPLRAITAPSSSATQVDQTDENIPLWQLRQDFKENVSKLPNWKKWVVTHRKDNIFTRCLNFFLLIFALPSPVKQLVRDIDHIEEECKAIIHKDPKLFEGFSSDLRSDEEIALIAIQEDIICFKSLTNHVQTNPTVIRAALKKDFHVIDLLSQYQRGRSFVLHEYIQNLSINHPHELRAKLLDAFQSTKVTLPSTDELPYVSKILSKVLPFFPPGKQVGSALLRSTNLTLLALRHEYVQSMAEQYPNQLRQLLLQELTATLKYATDHPKTICQLPEIWQTLINLQSTSTACQALYTSLLSRKEIARDILYIKPSLYKDCSEKVRQDFEITKDVLIRQPHLMHQVPSKLQCNRALIEQVIAANPHAISVITRVVDESFLIELLHKYPSFHKFALEENYRTIMPPLLENLLEEPTTSSNPNGFMNAFDIAANTEKFIVSKFPEAQSWYWQAMIHEKTRGTIQLHSREKPAPYQLKEVGDVLSVGNHQVKFVAIDSTQAFIHRRYEIISPDGSLRPFDHCEFKTWPDMKLPDSSDLHELMNAYLLLEAAKDQPVHVHCISGRGRSGTFVFIRALMSQEPSCDPAALLQELRTKRRGIVETEEQFKYAIAMASSLSGKKFNIDAVYPRKKSHTTPGLDS